MIDRVRSEDSAMADASRSLSSIIDEISQHRWQTQSRSDRYLCQIMDAYSSCS